MLLPLSTFLIICMFVSLIYTELIFKIFSWNMKNKKTNIQKNEREIIEEILYKHNLSDKIKIDSSKEIKISESCYINDTKTILLSDEKNTVRSFGCAVHECGHAIQYNKSLFSFFLIYIRDLLRKFILFDVLSPFSVPFFYVFCTPLYVISCFFLIKLLVRVVLEFLIEMDASRRILRYTHIYIKDSETRKNVKKFLCLSALTYLSTLT